MKKTYKTVIFIVIFLISSLFFTLRAWASKNFEYRYFFREDIHNVLARMSIEEKIGQILIFGFSDYKLDEDYERWLISGELGNIKLFLRNVRSKKQVQELTDRIATLALNSPQGIPPFIATDMEGGTVNHIRYRGIFLAPAAGLVGAIGDVESSRKAAKLIALTLYEHGINLNFAPCVDVLTNRGNRVIGTRSYGSDPQLVYRMAKAFIEEHRKLGILTTAKHFPGHGMTRFDSHLSADSVDTTKENLFNVHLYPYWQLIQDRKLNGVMASHITYTRADPFYPASLSQLIIEEYLRGEMGFNGIVVTDDLEMQGILQYAGDLLKVFILAFRAGNDLFLVSHTKELQETLIGEVAALFENGILREEELDDKVLRILRAKKRHLNRFYATHGGTLVQKKLLEQAIEENEKVSYQGIVLVSSNVNGSIPAYFKAAVHDKKKGLVLAPTKSFGIRVGRYLPGWDIIDIDYYPDRTANTRRIEEVRKNFKLYDLILLGFANERHVPWARACIQEKTPFAILSYDNPHYTSRFSPNALFIVTSFGPYNPAATALFRTVFVTGKFSENFPYKF
jgi:beta-glucosidase-like glycosyl hydrolase